MFSYFGGKGKIAHKYPKPDYNIIVEPFAGSARYACLYPDKQVHLYDINSKIVAIWKYLIAATPKDLLSLPAIEEGQSLEQFQSLSDAERWLMGFCVNRGSVQPKLKAKRCNWIKNREDLSEFVSRIKHWTVSQQSYETIPNQRATWFIDPPYQVMGKYYQGFRNIDFTKLAAWCQNRWGQALVCESMGANWLPFIPLTKSAGSMRVTTEVLWQQHKVVDHREAK